jgi:hypothetical protein
MNRSQSLQGPRGPRVAPAVLIRVSSLVYLFLMIGHTSGYPWASTRDPQETQLVDSMKSLEFVFAGRGSTYWNLYFGWGVLVAVLLLTQAILLWLSSDLARLAPRRIGFMTGLMSANSFIGAYLSFRFFYIPPVICYLIAGLLLLAAAVQLLQARSEVPDTLTTA